MWLTVTQGLLINAAALVLKDYPWPTIGIAVLAILLTLSIGHSIRNSFESRQWFKARWRERIEASGKVIGKSDVLPLDGGYPDNNAVRRLLPGNFIPVVIIAAWLMLIAYVACQLGRISRTRKPS
jgi:hypothetical protein